MHYIAVKGLLWLGPTDLACDAWLLNAWMLLPCILSRSFSSSGSSILWRQVHGSALHCTSGKAKNQISRWAFVRHLVHTHTYKHKLRLVSGYYYPDIYYNIERICWNCWEERKRVLESLNVHFSRTICTRCYIRYSERERERNLLFVLHQRCTNDFPLIVNRKWWEMATNVFNFTTYFERITTCKLIISNVWHAFVTSAIFRYICNSIERQNFWSNSTKHKSELLPW